MKRTSSEPLALVHCDWGSPPETLALSPDDVHVWSVRLNQEEPILRVLEETLGPDERARAGRFHFERDRRRFISAHGQLRKIIGGYVIVNPGALEFSYGAHGKPALAQPSGENVLKFNLSHSGEMALVGITQSRSIGVDLEEIHSFEDANRIAERFFSPRENIVFCSLPEAEKLEAFFRCWTRKEAYLKATGDGLMRPTELFDVAFGPGEPARLLSVEGEPGEASRWSMVGLTPASGYVGAVAVEGHGWTLACWHGELA